MMTGDARGNCAPVSGSVYLGRDNGPANCPEGSGRFVPRRQPSQPVPVAPAPHDFSIWPPIRQAHERGTQAVTGSAFSNQRITGSVNKAGGLITGTPEFRHSGIGTQMIGKLANKLSQQRREFITLEVRETNLHAQMFFREQGFQATRVLRDHYQDTSEDAYVMQFALHEQGNLRRCHNQAKARQH